MISDLIHIVNKIVAVRSDLQWRGLRKLLLFAGCWLVASNILIGQLAGDYRSVAAGDWSVLANWQRYDGGAWNIPTFGQGYPGQNNTPGRVDINNNITLNVGPANQLGDLYINSGTLQLSSFNLSIGGITNVTGILSDNNISGIVSFYGVVTITNTGIWTSVSSPSSNLQLYNNVVNNSSNVILDRVRVYSDIIISGSGVMTVLDFFEFNSSYTVTNTSTVIIAGAINSNNSLATWNNGSNSTLNYSGTSTLMNSLGSLIASASGNIINYTAGGNQSIIVPAGSTYFNLSTNTSGTKTLAGNININGDLLIGIGTILDVSFSNYSINVDGNWNNQGSFSERFGTVTFSGTNTQTISRAGGETFSRLVTNNTGGQLDIASGNVTVSNLLTMTSGNITTGSNILILTPNTTGSLSHTSGTIIGRFRRGVASTGAPYLFPVGTSSFYRPAVFNFSTLDSPISITGQFIEADPGAFTPYLDGGSIQLDDAFSDDFREE